MSAAWSTGYRNRLVLTSSFSRSTFSLNWVMRWRSPYAVTDESSQHSSECSFTSDWRNRMQRSGSSPAAISIPAVSST